jgi:hypothetical protein
MPDGHASHKNGWTVHEFHPEFTAAADAFLSGFREFLLLKAEALTEGPEDQFDDDLWSLFDSPEEYTRGTFGGNVFLSLSGAGCGFQDDKETEALHAALKEYAASRYQFEEIDLCKFSGQIHLAYRTASFRREYLAKLFSVSPTLATVAP